MTKKNAKIDSLPSQFQLFGGTGYSDGTPHPLPYPSFGAWVAGWLSVPVVCHLESADYHALTPTEQKEAKSTGYFCTGSFKPPHRRRLSDLECCHLLVLDVDDPTSAAALLAAPLDDLIPWNFALWQTLTSTPEKPRVRLVVESVPLTGEEYRASVMWLAARLGVEEYDPVSVDPVHLWYRPTVFADRAATTPLFASRTTGSACTPGRIDDGEPVADRTVTDLSAIVPPADDITLEDAKAMLATLDPDNPPYWGWVRPLMALRHQFSASEEAFEVFDEWSQRGGKYPGQEATRRKWRAFASAPTDRDPITIRSLIASARAAGWTASGEKSLRALEKRIAEAPDLPTLTGPLLKAIHDSVLLSPLEVEVLLARASVRAKALKAPVNVKALREALCALDADTSASSASTIVPAQIQGYIYVRESNLWVHPVRQTRVTPVAFDLGFSALLPEDAGRPSTYATRTLGLSTVDREMYSPSRPTDLIYTDEQGVVIANTYRQSYPEPDPASADEAGEILHDHLMLLLANDERLVSLFTSWMAWTVRNPGQKCSWHVFLQGAQGCGKSLLAEALRVVHGPTNARKVSPTMLTEKFNLWAEGCTFAYFEEVLIGDRQRDTMEVIKDLVTGDTVNIRAMRSDAVERKNYFNGLFLSNHHHGLRLERSDRRFFCLVAAQQTKKQSEAIPTEHFQAVVRLRGSLAGGLRHHLLHCPLDNEFSPTGHAPDSPHRETVLRAGASELDSAIQTVIDENEHALIGPDVLSSSALHAAVRSDVRNCSSKQVCRVITEMGYKQIGQRLLSNGERHVLWYHPERIERGVTATQAINLRLAQKEVL